MKRKKLVMLMAASAVALSLVACGGSADSGVEIGRAHV